MELGLRTGFSGTANWFEGMGIVLIRFPMRSWLLVSLCIFVLGLTSCETTQSGYGYIAETFDRQAIMDLVVLSDQTINERDYEVYKELFAPGYYSLNKSDRFEMSHPRMNRFDYLALAREVLERAEEIVVYSEVTDIEIIEPGKLAKVSIQEDMRIDYMSSRKRMVSIVEIEVGFEDGWIFFESATTLAKREVKE